MWFRKRHRSSLVSKVCYVLLFHSISLKLNYKWVFLFLLFNYKWNKEKCVNWIRRKKRRESCFTLITSEMRELKWTRAKIKVKWKEGNGWVKGVSEGSTLLSFHFIHSSSFLLFTFNLQGDAWNWKRNKVVFLSLFQLNSRLHCNLTEAKWRKNIT